MHKALVMAARRKGIEDPLAVKGGVTHKCLIDMDGVPMIERVIASLIYADTIGEIVISIDEPEVLSHIPLIAEGIRAGKIRTVPSGENLWLSVKGALTDDMYPVVVCTADNALQTAEMVDYFIAEVDKDGCDVGVAMTNAETIWAKYPEGQRRPHKFADGKWSNCNLFALKSPAAMHAAKAFEGGGQFGKSKKRVLQAFGWFNLLLYVSKLMTLKGTFRRVSKRFGLTVTPIELPWAEAPIDVDNERTERIAREILVARREAA
ncbi:MAG: NTP transferase domain-containing protein [Pseudomonadota bacterium]